MSKIKVSLEEIFESIKRYRDRLSAGSDGIPAFFLLLSLPILLVFNKSLDAGYFPTVVRISTFSLKILPIL